MSCNSKSERGERFKISRMWHVDSDRPVLDIRRRKNTEPPAQAWCDSTTHTWKRHTNHSPQLPASKRAAVLGPVFRLARKRQSAPLRQRRRGVTPTAPLDAGTRRRPASMVFGPELAYMGAVWQSRRGSRPQMWLPAPLKRRSRGTVPGQFSANLWASHGSGIASTTVKILHKVLPAPKIHITNMLQNLIVIHLINRIQFIAYHGMRPSE